MLYKKYKLNERSYILPKILRTWKKNKKVT